MATSAAMDSVVESLSQPLPPTESPSNIPPVTDSAAANHGTASTSPKSSEFPDGPSKDHGNSDDGDIAWLNINELSEGDTDELQKCVNLCVERWKAAGPEARKKMFALFAVSGIFISVCRHGHVLVLCDMIRSGELYAKILCFISISCVISDIPYLQHEISPSNCLQALRKIRLRSRHRLRHHVRVLQNPSPQLLGS